VALPASGSISLSQVNVELGLSSTATIDLNRSDVRNLAGLASGVISMNDLLGKSAAVYTTDATKGYFGGGHVFGGENNFVQNVIDGILFSNDTAFNPAATLADGARGGVGGVTSSAKGYFGGGFTIRNLSGGGVEFVPQIVIDGILFSNDTAFNPAATFPEPIGAYVAGVNSASKGFFASGGAKNDGTPLSIHGILFSNDTSFTTGARISTNKFNIAGVHSSIKGYFASSFSDAAIDSIIFSNETAVNSVASLADGLRAYVGGVNSSTKGYFAGGQVDIKSNYTNVIDGILFSNDTAFNPAATLSDGGGGRAYVAGVNSSVKGYFGGGENANFSNSSSIDGILFSNDTAFNPAATLSDGARRTSGVQNSNN
jgi:hypothetical protein